MRIRHGFWGVIVSSLFILILTIGWCGNISNVEAKEKESVLMVKI